MDTEAMSRLHRLKAAETALLASLTPLVMWGIALDIPIRSGTVREYYAGLVQFPQCVPNTLFVACTLALYGIVFQRRAALGIAFPTQRAARQQDHRFRMIWLGILGAAGFTLMSASEFPQWTSSYTPLAVTALGAMLAWCRSWFETKQGMAIPCAKAPFEPVAG